MLKNPRRTIATTLVIACAATFLLGQVAKKRTTSKGPRAVALLQVADSGRARLIPVVIMVGNEFYDAGAYKADPVPMALQSGTVYEAVKAGVSQGLFTVGGAAQANGNWFADGKWVTAAQIEADKTKSELAKKAQTEPAPDVEVGGPPKLKRAPDSGSPSAPQKSSPQPSSPAPPSAEPTQKSASSNPGSKSSDSPGTLPDDPNRPVLRRQPLTGTTREQTKSGPDTEPLTGPVQFIAAISDADGPQPRPYTFILKPEEEQHFQKKMLALAAGELKDRAAPPTPDEKPGPKSRAAGKKSHSAPAPEFHDVQMRAFDISNTNEAVLVLTARATLPASETQYSVVVVAREDIYAELHKIFAKITDNKSLDILPRYEFIDAVDADGDGRGELLFRETWDSGTAYAVYRVIGDRLWPLFEGKPGT
jgi:hypothetical protein